MIIGIHVSMLLRRPMFDYSGAHLNGGGVFVCVRERMSVRARVCMRVHICVRFCGVCVCR